MGDYGNTVLSMTGTLHISLELELKFYSFVLVPLDVQSFWPPSVGPECHLHCSTRGLDLVHVRTTVPQAQMVSYRMRSLFNDRPN